MYDRIITHARPHLDEITAIWLLRKFGEEMFPGIRSAVVEYWTSGSEALLKTPEQYEKEGTLLIGVGRGRFDEHPVNGQPKEGCAATLVAKALGLEEDPLLQQILKFVSANDLKGSGHAFDLAHLINIMHQQFPNDPTKVTDWAVTGLETKLAEQSEFFGDARQEFEQNARVVEFGSPGRKIRLAVLVSDNEKLAKFARSIHGGRSDVVIQKKSSGNVQIFTRRSSGLKLFELAQLLRYEEQRSKGVFRTTDWKTLAAPGTLPGSEEWFYQQAGEMLLNGSLTAKDVKPTGLSLEKIEELAMIALTPRAFEPERAGECLKDICTSSSRNQCPWYSWGLHRCRLNRYKMSQTKVLAS